MSNENELLLKSNFFNPGVMYWYR